jgi:hypothetical protein
MSLINDALKRANEAQQKGEQTPPPELKFREVDPRQAHPRRFGWLLPSTITACVLVGVFVVWQMKSGKGEKSALPNVQPPAKEATGDSGALKVHAREEQVLPGAPLAVTKAPEPAQSEKVAIVSVSGTTIQETTKREVTNAPASSEGAVVKAAPKLQGIVFNPRSPSATISGKTVFVGERVGEWRVSAIDKDTATLVGVANGETNVLRLGE